MVNFECYLFVFVILQYKIMKLQKFRIRKDDLEFGDEVIQFFYFMSQETEVQYFGQGTEVFGLVQFFLNYFGNKCRGFICLIYRFLFYFLVFYDIFFKWDCIVN